jgi:hypothetical protein
MANLTGPHRSDRAQLILVTAFALAAISLGLAIIVNSAIFTENLATRSENVDSTEALEYRHTTTQLTAEVMEYANTFNSSSEAALWQNVSHGVRAINDYSGIQQSRSGAAIALELNRSTNGSRIFQTDGTDFTANGTTSGDWTLATNVEQTRAFEINVSSFPGNGFAVVVNGTDEWRAEIDSSGIDVERPSGASETCSVTPETIDLTGATVNGEPCPALIDTTTGEPLQFGAGVSGDYAIEFENPDDIEGGYSLVVDNSSLDAVTNDNYADDTSPGNNPQVTPAIYSAVVRMEYQTPEIDYRTMVRVAPGEPR